MRGLLVVLAALQVALLYGICLGEGGLRDVWNTRAQIAQQKGENQRLEARNRGLEAEVADLKDGMEAIEELARSEMGMIRDGEVFIQLVDKVPAPGKQP